MRSHPLPGNIPRVNIIILVKGKVILQQHNKNYSHCITEV